MQHSMRPSKIFKQSCVGLTVFFSSRLTCCKSVNRAGKLLLDIAAAGPYMLTTGRGKGDSGQDTYLGYHGRHRSRPDHILMTPNFYHNLLSTDIQPSNKRIADHCSITACFKVRQGGLTGAAMNLEPHHVCHGGCPKHNLRWNSDKALKYTEHLENNTEGRNSSLKAIGRKDVVEAANNYLRAMIISAACTSGLGKFSPCVFYWKNQRVAAGARKAPWLDDVCRRKRRGFLRSLRDGREDSQDTKSTESIRGGLHANSHNNRLLFFWTN